MELIKRENQFSQNEVVYEVLDRREVIEIMDSLDNNEIQRKLMEMAYDESYKCDYNSFVIAELSVKTGEIYYTYRASNTTEAQPDLYIRLGSKSANPEYFEYEDEDILDGDAREEYFSMIENEDSEFYKDKESAFDFVLNKYNLDRKELAKNYFLEYYLDSVELESRESMMEELRRIYSAESIVDAEVDKAGIVRDLDPYRDRFGEYFSCSDKEELVSEVVRYLKDSEYEFGLNKDDFEDEDDFEQAVYDIEDKHVEEMIEWRGAGGYFMYDSDMKYINVLHVDECLDSVLDELEVGIDLDLDAFNNPTAFMQKWKDDEGYKYIYMIIHVSHVCVPNEYSLEALVYSNEKIDNVFEYLEENEGVKIGEFDILGANYSVKECEDFDMDTVSRYKSESFDIKTYYIEG